MDALVNDLLGQELDAKERADELHVSQNANLLQSFEFLTLLFRNSSLKSTSVRSKGRGRGLLSSAFWISSPILCIPSFHSLLLLFFFCFSSATLLLVFSSSLISSFLSHLLLLLLPICPNSPSCFSSSLLAVSLFIPWFRLRVPASLQTAPDTLQGATSGIEASRRWAASSRDTDR